MDELTDREALLLLKKRNARAREVISRMQARIEELEEWNRRVTERRDYLLVKARAAEAVVEAARNLFPPGATIWDSPRMAPLCAALSHYDEVTK